MEHSWSSSTHSLRSCSRRLSWRRTRAATVPASRAEYAALATLGIVHTALTGFLFLGGMRRVRTDHVAILTYVEPVSAVVLAAIFLGEPLTAATLVGGVLVVAGGVLVARIESREAYPLEVADAEEPA